MAKLNDYIASLVASITDARLATDVETAKIAEIYKNHEILRYFSIPRMRIGDVNLSVPVAIDYALSGASINYKLDIYNLTEGVFIEVYQDYGLTEKQIYLYKYQEIITGIKKDIHNSLTQLNEAICESRNIQAIPESAYKISDNVKDPLMKISESVGKVPVEEVADKLSIYLTNSYLNTSVENLDVIVEASRLKEVDSSAIFHVNLNIKEEGMLWSISQNDKGEVQTRLEPE